MELLILIVLLIIIIIATLCLYYTYSMYSFLKSGCSSVTAYSVPQNTTTQQQQKTIKSIQDSLKPNSTQELQALSTALPAAIILL